MSTVKLDEFRAAKQGLVTPTQIANRFLSEIEADNVDICVVMYRTKDGEIRSGISECRFTELIGMVEWVKHDLLYTKE